MVQAWIENYRPIKQLREQVSLELWEAVKQRRL